MSNTQALQAHYHHHLAEQKTAETQALEILLGLQELNDHDVQLTLFGEALAGKSVQQLIALHKEATHHAQTKVIELSDTLDVIHQLKQAQLTAVRADIGQLIVHGDVHTVIANAQSGTNQATDVVLYGFGRIGRILTRLLMSQAVSTTGLQLKAIVVRPAPSGDLAKRASLLQRDSVHGSFVGDVKVDDIHNGIIINGRFVQVIYAKNPSEIDYTAYGIDDALIIDNTGIWTDRAGLSEHLKAKGASKVLLTAPAKGDIKNIVYNVNTHDIGDANIVSAASCTTNAITPTLKVLNDRYGVETGHVETIHAFTNDQNLIDNYHKKDRRGRSAPLNMVITSTGAAKAVGKALPELNGKLTGNAIRVPTPNVSIAILNLNLKNAPNNTEELNQYLKQIATSNLWQEQIAYSDSPEAVSTDFVGTQKVGIIDLQATIVTDNHATVYVWYDNEMGYGTQVLRVANAMVGINHTQLPN